MRYRRKIIEVEALQCNETNLDEITKFSLSFDKPKLIFGINSEGKEETIGIEIHTPSGFIRVYFGDWIIKGSNGELSRYKPDAFKKDYELAIS